jgi:hypothetical protein
MDTIRQGIEGIKHLVLQGVLSPELCPEQEYWHWDVLKPEELPEWLKENAEYYGEVRWYGM